jgi:hypothetical protein
VSQWTDWEIVRHQVAIGGRVVDHRDQPIAGAHVMITAMPQAYRRKVDGAASATGSEWQRLDHRLDRTRTQADGVYYFLDLPSGRYTLQGVDGRSGAHGETTVSVAWDREGNVQRVTADLKLSTA